MVKPGFIKLIGSPQKSSDINIFLAPIRTTRIVYNKGLIILIKYFSTVRVLCQVKIRFSLKKNDGFQVRSGTEGGQKQPCPPYHKIYENLCFSTYDTYLHC